MDALLFLRLASQSEPLELGRVAAIRSVQQGARSRLWTAGRNHGLAPPDLLGSVVLRQLSSDFVTDSGAVPRTLSLHAELRTKIGTPAPSSFPETVN